MVIEIDSDEIRSITIDGENVVEVTTDGNKVFPGDYGNGQDGSLNVSSSNVNINNYTYLDSNVSSGSNELSVNNSSVFDSGEEILIYQVQSSSGDPPAGNYEIKRISSISSGSILLESGLINSYTSNDFNNTTSNVTIIVNIPEYTSVNISGSVSPDQWNGFTGGVTIFKCNGTTDIDGNINATGRGFRGGLGETDRFGTGDQGESYEGIGVESRSANEGGGGGGGDPNDSNTEGGGGGGGYGSSGNDGVIDNFPGDEGSGGNTYGTSDLSRIHLGSGGGGGSMDDDSDGSGRDRGSNGGNGGGIVFVISKNITGSGSIISNGQDGEDVLNDSSEEPGAGGGGSGGSIKIKTDSMGVLTQVSGGAGGDNPHGELGGDGGSGRTHIM